MPSCLTIFCIALICFFFIEKDVFGLSDGVHEDFLRIRQRLSRSRATRGVPEPSADSSRSSRLMVAVPFIHRDEIGRVIDQWTREGPPCAKAKLKVRVSLELVFDKIIKHSEKAELVSLLSDRMSTDLGGCFESVSIQDMAIPSDQNIYDKKRTTSAWVAGPNHVFYDYVLSLGEKGSHRYLLWLEPDVLSVKEGWLNQVVDLLPTLPSTFWVAGSTFAGDCLPDEQYEQCPEPSPPAIAKHINGNALYHVTNPEFLKACRTIHNGLHEHPPSRASLHPLADWPFDLAIYRWLHDGFQPGDARAKYISSNFILNYGRFPWRLNELPPETLLVHGTNIDGVNGGKHLLRIEDDHESLWRLVSNAANWDQQLLVTFLTSNYWSLFRNFVDHLSRIHLHSHLLVVCFADDPDCPAQVTTLKLNYYLLSRESEENLPAGSDQYGSKLFRDVVNQKAQLLEQLGRMPYSILLTDIDTVWLRNPLEYLREFELDYEMQFQLDSRMGVGIAYPSSNFSVFLNSGVVYLSKYSTRDADLYALLSDALQSLEACKGKTEQWALNYLFENRLVPPEIRVRLLDSALFPNGVAFFERGLPAQQGIAPFVVHNNWVNGLNAKIFRFQQLGLWTVDDAMPAPRATRYLTYQDAVHNNGISNQLQSLYSALAYAQLTNRTLILPPFYSYHLRDVETTPDMFFDLEQFKSAIGAVVPHGLLGKLVPCTSAVFYVETLPSHASHVLAGTSNSLGIDFASDRNCPQRIQNPSLYKRTVIRHKPGRLQGQGLSESEILDWLSPYQDLPLLVFAGMFRRFAGFSDLEKEQKLRAQFQQAVTPCPELLQIVDAVVRNMGNQFDCFHLRYLDEFPHKSKLSLPELLQKFVRKIGPQTRRVYLSTDQPDATTAKQILSTKFQLVVKSLEDTLPSWWADQFKASSIATTSHRLALVDQLVCARSQKFVGTVMSSFSQSICMLRGRKGCIDIDNRLFPR